MKMMTRLLALVMALLLCVPALAETAGSPDDVRATLEQMVAESGADELMIQDLIADPAARRRSHELLAQAFGITPQPDPAEAQ